MKVQLTEHNRIPAPGYGARIAMDHDRLGIVRGPQLFIGTIGKPLSKHHFPGNDFKHLILQSEVILAAPYKLSGSPPVIKSSPSLMELNKTYPNHPGRVEITAAAFDRQGDRYVAGLNLRPPNTKKKAPRPKSKCKLQVLNQSQDQPITLHETSTAYTAVAIQKDLVAASAQKLHVWQSGSPFGVSEALEFAIRRIAISQEQILATTDAAGNLSLWSANTWRCLGSQTVHKGDTQGLAFYEENLVVTGGDDAVCRFWSTDSEIRCIAEQTTPGPVYDIAFSPDGEWMAVLTGSFGDLVIIYQVH